MDYAARLGALRKSVKKHNLDGYVQPVHDEYMSEYPPACNRRVEWLCGFSGSAGTAVVLAAKAALFVDGRYTLQAKNEVSGKAYAHFNSGSTSPEMWLAESLKPGARVGYDAKIFTQGLLRRMQSVLSKKKIELVPVVNLVDAVWEKRPAAPASAVRIHEQKYAGESSSSKRKHLAKTIASQGADMAVITAPDSVDWLLNIRGNDVENTPLALATALLDAKGKVTLFIKPSRISAKVKTHLSKDVAVKEPAALEAELKKLKKKRVQCDPASVPVWFTQVLGKAGAQVVEATDPCVLPKAMKNKTELSGIRAAHIRDGAAVVKLLCWLDKRTQQRAITEIDVSIKLAGFRAEHKMFREPSFTTIAGSGPHGAIVHYRVTPESNRQLKDGELFLLDSGGQYPDGTTDITRTVPIGKPSSEHKDRFTRVLKGHIAIATAKFPQGTGGSQLDALARQYLWQAGLDYDHGTGHGVGQYLGVHEGPQRISKRGGDAALMPGMIVSNEPGYYKTGAYGIRIENLVAVCEQAKVEGKVILGFETVTCVPIDTRLVDDALMSVAEKAWLNSYHAWVYSSLAEHLDEAGRAWLKVRCAAI